MDVNDPWYKNAIIYAVDIRRFQDSDGDGCGDFRGLIDRLDYLADLGVTCLWLLPFYPSPFRDNGYDITNYFGVDPRFGTFDDWLELLHEAGERSLRIMIDLVLQHTSDDHPWFEAARRDPASPYRDYYSWAEHPPPVPPGESTIFPGQEKSVWTYDEVAKAYYYHTFYHFEPDLDTSNPRVLDELQRILDFWLSFNVSGLRIDAAPHMISAHGTEETQPDAPHQILKDIHAAADRRKGNMALLGEVNVDPEKLVSYFGDGDELDLLYNFLLNNYLFLAMAREKARPIVRALKQLPSPVAMCQWTNFLRNLDELDMKRLPDADRDEVLDAFAPEEEQRIFAHDIRLRLASMFDDERRLRLAFSLLFALPGIPLVVYGDEIGMGTDLSQEGRDAVRSPMQWSDEQNAGFSDAAPDELVQPVIDSGPRRYEQVNVAAQEDDPDSLFHFVKQLIYTRRSCPEIGQGTWRTFHVDDEAVLAHRCVWRDGMVVLVHNLAGEATTIELDLRDQRGRRLQNLYDESMAEPLGKGNHQIDLEPYAYRWFRVVGERNE